MPKPKPDRYAKVHAALTKAGRGHVAHAVAKKCGKRPK